MKDDAVNVGSSRQTSIAWACLLLSLALALAFPLVAWFAHRGHGVAGIVAAAVAAGVCWLGALLALLLIGLFRGTPQVVHVTLLGMLFRMGLPLLVGIVLSRGGGPLAEAGVFGMILVFYLVGLVVETTLSVRLIGSSQRVAKAS